MWPNYSVWSIPNFLLVCLSSFQSNPCWWNHSYPQSHHHVFPPHLPAVRVAQRPNRCPVPHHWCAENRGDPPPAAPQGSTQWPNYQLAIIGIDGMVYRLVKTICLKKNCTTQNGWWFMKMADENWVYQPVKWYLRILLSHQDPPFSSMIFPGIKPPLTWDFPWKIAMLDYRRIFITAACQPSGCAFVLGKFLQRHENWRGTPKLLFTRGQVIFQVHEIKSFQTSCTGKSGKHPRCTGWIN